MTEINYDVDAEVSGITRKKTGPFVAKRKDKINSLFADLMKDLSEMESLEKNIEEKLASRTHTSYKVNTNL